ncbi:ubiquitin-like protein 4A [Ischnura elegans]|uniref:ubiquitin-like protein 4A n=1 Tax=Ischnura elegans TaxID=197161 RepID=UPI001ED86A99|nr:ubiquitin-like protein 4A [Ischnura elegans]XP_046400667.1 ubiquitin-like protein 4A [Ischnura elegans]
MKINVKVLQGQECTLEVSEETKVLDLKKMVEKELKVSPGHQKLLYLGKPLSDSNALKEYSIKDGAKMNLIIKKVEDSNSVAAKEVPPVIPVTSLQEAVTTFLRKYYNESDSKRVLNEFMTEFDRSLAALSLDDIERLAATCMLDEKHTV